MGKKKAPTPKVEKAKSAFGGVTQSNVDLGGLFSANAAKTGDSLNTTTSVGGLLQPIQTQALSGLSGAQQELNTSNADQLSRIDAGNNSTYNLLDEVNKRNAATALAKAQSRYSLNGLDNSTVRGAFEASTVNDAMLRDLAARQQAIDANRAAALQAGQFQQGVLNGLISGQQYAGNLSNQNLTTALNDQSAVSQFNAQAQNAANNLIYQQQLAEYNQPRPWEQLVGTLAPGGAMIAGAISGNNNLFNSGMQTTQALLPIAGAALGGLGGGAGLGTTAPISFMKSATGGFG